MVYSLSIPTYQRVHRNKEKQPPRVKVCLCVCAQSLQGCCFSGVWSFATPWTIACQSSLSMGFSRQEYWSGLWCPSSGGLPDPGIKPASPVSPALQVDSLPTEASGKLKQHLFQVNFAVLCVLWCFFLVSTLVQENFQEIYTITSSSVWSDKLLSYKWSWTFLKTAFIFISGNMWKQDDFFIYLEQNFFLFLFPWDNKSSDSYYILVLDIPKV